MIVPGKENACLSKAELEVADFYYTCYDCRADAGQYCERSKQRNNRICYNFKRNAPRIEEDAFFEKRCRTLFDRNPWYPPDLDSDDGYFYDKFHEKKE
jgi:hypothetical protein